MSFQKIFSKKKINEKSDKSNDEAQKERCSLQMQAKCLAKITNVSYFCLNFRLWFYDSLEPKKSKK